MNEIISSKYIDISKFDLKFLNIREKKLINPSFLGKNDIRINLIKAKIILMFPEIALLSKLDTLLDFFIVTSN